MKKFIVVNDFSEVENDFDTLNEAKKYISKEEVFTKLYLYAKLEHLEYKIPKRECSKWCFKGEGHVNCSCCALWSKK